MTPEDAALDALAVALAPRLLRELRSLITAEADDDRALGIAGLAELGFKPGQGPDLSPTEPRKRPSRKPREALGPRST